MNYSRIAIAAVVATIVDGIYGFVVYGNALANQFAQFPGVFRPAASQGQYMPYLFGGILVAMFSASYIFAKGYEGGSGIAEGIRFGICVGFLEIGYSVIVGYAVTNVSGGLAATMTVAALVEWIIVGAVIGAVYKPAAHPTRRTATV